MTLYPLSAFFEIAILIIAFLLMDYRAVGRFAAIGCFMFEIALLTAPQEYLIEYAGVLTSTTSSLPSALLGTLVFVMVILTYVAMANLFDWFDRDIFGRRGRS